MLATWGQLEALYKAKINSFNYPGRRVVGGHFGANLDHSIKNASTKKYLEAKQGMQLMFWSANKFILKCRSL